MASMSAQSDLVSNTVKAYRDIAEGSVRAAQDALESLISQQQQIDLSVIDTTIGTNVPITTTATIADPSAVTEPTWMSTIIASLPTELPTITDPSFTAPDEPTAPTLNTTPLTATETLTIGDITLPTLGELPTMTAVTPTIPTDTLTATYSYTEPTYTGEISSTLKAEFLRVLGGSMGLPAAYWSALWAHVSGDLAKQMVGKLRTARNRGAASFWQLPSEPVLAASRDIQDETTKALQQGRLQQALAEATMAREDYWSAVEKGLAYEAKWIEMHDHMAQRALASAEQQVNALISVFNANREGLKLLVEAAKIATDIDKTKLEAVLRAYEGQMQGAQTKAMVLKTQVEAFQAKYAALTGVYNANTSRQQMLVQSYGEEVKAFNGLLDGRVKIAELPVEIAKIRSEVFGTQYSAVDAIANATKAIMESRVGVERLKVDASVAKGNLESARNEINVKIGDLTVRAQEAKARIDVAQAEWSAYTSKELTTSYAQLSTGLAQAMAAGAHVQMSAGTTMSIGQDINLSLNQPQVTSWIWG